MTSSAIPLEAALVQQKHYCRSAGRERLTLETADFESLVLRLVMITLLQQ